jgi:glycosyltransferase involved in cell wall biosynthesis
VRALRHAVDWQLNVYGDGPLRGRLERLAAREGVFDRVHFHGPVDRRTLFDELARADAFIFPSLHDSCSWAVAEAAAQGLPVICLPIGGQRSTAGPSAVIVPLEGDIASGLATALRALPHDPEVDPEWVRTRWSQERLPDLLEQWYTPGTLRQRDREVGRLLGSGLVSAADNRRR